MRAYLSLLRTPSAAAFCAAGFLTRLGGAMSSMAMILMMTAIYGSYTLAGGLTAVNSIAWAAGSAFLGHLVDRFGQRLVVLPSVLVSSCLLLCVALLAWLGMPAWTLFIPTVLCGATSVSIPAAVIARWHHVTDTPEQFQTALSLESTLDDITRVAGPFLATLLAFSISPVAGVVAVGCTSMVGATILHLQRSSVPPVVPREPTKQRAGGFLPAIPGVAPMVAIAAAIGVFIGAVGVSVVAATDAWGAKDTSGTIMAMISLSSALAGLAYGARRWSTPLARRFVISLAALAVGAGLFVGAWTPLTLGACAFFAGIPLAPTFINTNALVQRLVPPRRLTEGMTWSGTSVGIGIALGSALAGMLIDEVGYRAGFGCAAGGAAVALLIVLACVGVISRHARDDTPPEVSPELTEELR